ncbi:hypothetical protein AAZX31_02G219600 [Glycine max]
MVVTMTIYFQIAAPAVCNDNNIYEVSSIHYCDSKSPFRYALLSTISVIFFYTNLQFQVYSVRNQPLFLSMIFFNFIFLFFYFFINFRNPSSIHYLIILSK